MKILLWIYCIVTLAYSLYANGNKSNFSRIIVEVQGLRNSNGNIRSHLYNSPQFFPTKSDSAFKRVVQPIVDGKCVIVFDDIEFGDYALTIHHDENENVMMDRNLLGLLAEGWGISNNPKLIFTLPKFESAKFFLNKSEIRLKVKLN